MNFNISELVYSIVIETGVDLVLIQPLLPAYVNHVVLTLTSILQHNFHKKTKEVSVVLKLGLDTLGRLFKRSLT